MDLVSANKIPGPLKHTIRALCKQCNGDWANAVETEVKTVLQVLAVAGRRTFSRRDARVLATWALIVSVVAEVADYGAAAIPERDRRQMSIHHEPPDGAQVWAAVTDGPDWWLGYQHLGFDVFPVGTGFASDVPLTCQLTRIGFGRLALLVMTSRVLRIDIDLTVVPGVAQVWPSQGGHQWPPPSVMPWGDAVYWIDHVYNRIADQFGGHWRISAGSTSRLELEDDQRGS